MCRASLSAICTPSDIAAFHHCPDLRNEASDTGCDLSGAGLLGCGAESVLAAGSSCAGRRRAKGAVSTGRPVGSRTKPKNRPDFEYLSMLSSPPFINWCRFQNCPSQKRELVVGQGRQIEKWRILVAGHLGCRKPRVHERRGSFRHLHADFLGLLLVAHDLEHVVERHKARCFDALHQFAGAFIARPLFSSACFPTESHLISVYFRKPYRLESAGVRARHCPQIAKASANARSPAGPFSTAM